MNKYHVALIYSASTGLDVESDSPEEAAESAYNSKESSVRLCHQCSHKIDLGDCIRAIVTDENDKDVFDDGCEAERIASLETQIAKLEQERDTLILAVADHVTARSDQADALKLSRDALSGWIGSPNTEQYAALAAIDALKI